MRSSLRGNALIRSITKNSSAARLEARSPRLQTWFPLRALCTVAGIFNNQRIIAGAGSAIGPTIGGISTSLEMYPDLDWAVAILNNYDQIEVASLMKQVRHLITDHLS
jgi:hypothetical protein